MVLVFPQAEVERTRNAAEAAEAEAQARHQEDTARAFRSAEAVRHPGLKLNIPTLVVLHELVP